MDSSDTSSTWHIAIWLWGRLHGRREGQSKADISLLNRPFFFSPVFIFPGPLQQSWVVFGMSPLPLPSLSLSSPSLPSPALDCGCLSCLWSGLAEKIVAQMSAPMGKFNWKYFCNITHIISDTDYIALILYVDSCMYSLISEIILWYKSGPEFAFFMWSGCPMYLIQAFEVVSSCSKKTAIVCVPCQKKKVYAGVCGSGWILER